MEEEKKTTKMETKKELNFLQKNKYSFFNILSFAYSRAEARLLLNRLSQRGHELSSDSYIEIFEALIYNIEVRFPRQIDILSKLTGVQNKKQLLFDDDIQLDLFIDFKRESIDTITKMVKSI